MINNMEEYRSVLGDLIYLPFYLYQELIKSQQKKVNGDQDYCFQSSLFTWSIHF